VDGGVAAHAVYIDIELGHATVFWSSRESL
jgi:hypothetical protein